MCLSVLGQSPKANSGSRLKSGVLEVESNPDVLERPDGNLMNSEQHLALRAQNYFLNDCDSL